MDNLSRRNLLKKSLFGFAVLGASGLLLPGNIGITEASGDEKPGDSYGGYLKGKNLSKNSPSSPGWAPTEDNIQGPFYRKGAPFRAKISPPLSEGKVLLIRGRVWGYDTKKPLPGAVVHIWQANHQGRYDNDDPQNPPSPGTYNFRARLTTDEQGCYEYETIFPGRYKIGPDQWRPAHIHYMVEHPGYQSLITQLYFQGDPYNDSDSFIKKSLIIDLKTIRVKKGSYRQGDFDIVLAPKK